MFHPAVLNSFVFSKSDFLELKHVISSESEGPLRKKNVDHFKRYQVTT